MEAQFRFLDSEIKLVDMSYSSFKTLKLCSIVLTSRKSPVSNLRVPVFKGHNHLQVLLRIVHAALPARWSHNVQATLDSKENTRALVNATEKLDYSLVCIVYYCVSCVVLVKQLKVATYVFSAYFKLYLTPPIKAFEICACPYCFLQAPCLRYMAFPCNIALPSTKIGSGFLFASTTIIIVWVNDLFLCVIPPSTCHLQFAQYVH